MTKKRRNEVEPGLRGPGEWPLKIARQRLSRRAYTVPNGSMPMSAARIASRLCKIAGPRSVRYFSCSYFPALGFGIAVRFAIRVGGRVAFECALDARRSERELPPTLLICDIENVERLERLSHQVLGVRAFVVDGVPMFEACLFDDRPSVNSRCEAAHRRHATGGAEG